MSHALVLRILACAASITILSSAAHAGGYGGSSRLTSPIVSSSAQAILSYADRHRDGNFHVDHTESASASAEVSARGETGSGTAYSNTTIRNSAAITSWKRSVQRTNGNARTGSADGEGFSASFVKIRTEDGKYYIFKGIANTRASAGRSGAAKSSWGLAKSRGGRY